MKIEAVTFDASGTLIEPWPSVGAVYASVAREFGIRCPSEPITQQFFQAFRNRPEFSFSRPEWLEIVRQSFKGHAEVSEALFESIFERFSQPGSWKIYEDVLPALRKTKSHGIKMAVLSNCDDRLITLLERLGLAHYFDRIFVSSLIGAHKPDPRIFQHAAGQLGVEPSAILHVGDSDREDVAGARSAGFQFRRIRRGRKDAPHDIETLTQVIE